LVKAAGIRLLHAAAAATVLAINRYKNPEIGACIGHLDF
jgi:hypothetical protein